MLAAIDSFPIGEDARAQLKAFFGKRSNVLTGMTRRQSRQFLERTPYTFGGANSGTTVTALARGLGIRSQSAGDGFGFPYCQSGTQQFHRVSSLGGGWLWNSGERNLPWPDRLRANVENLVG